ncbi:4Fe-4S dicluster domain-containing protein [Deferribacter thermophilus]|uniref:4Fe-4S dicluster domain-containing protein n=1 Tax=Deferribacter thermophilus TaxID=53573 RepID=UPI003C272B00
MAQYAMVIDLKKCVGCGACAIACKTENNTQERKNGQSFNWADFLIKIEGNFPNVKYTQYPVLCNHCSKAACVAACPVEPKAMFKTEDGITMHNDERCIGCRSCQDACPYSVFNLDEEKDAQYSVISFNDDTEKVFERYHSNERVLSGAASGAEIANKTGAIPPYKTEYKHPDYEAVRRPGVVEKCIFCDHRVKNGEKPYCVVSCPSGARVFGDLHDKNSEVSKLLKKHKAYRLKEEAGTEPNVYYINSFQVR